MKPWVVAGPGYEYGGFAKLGDAEHAARHDPARVLAEVDAKRRIVALWERENRDRHGHAEGEARAWLMDEVLQSLALPYADHPDYDPAWRD